MKSCWTDIASNLDCQHLFDKGMKCSPEQMQTLRSLQDAARMHPGQILALAQIATDYQHQVAGLSAQQQQSAKQLEQVHCSSVEVSVLLTVEKDCEQTHLQRALGRNS